MLNARQKKSRFSLILISLLAIAGLLVLAYVFSSSITASSTPVGFSSSSYTNTGTFFKMHNYSMPQSDCEECQCPDPTKSVASFAPSSSSLQVELPPYFESIKAKPIFGASHNPSNNAVFALAMRYDADIFKQFVQSARNWGYKGDIVLGVSDYVEKRSGRGAQVASLIDKHKVIAYSIQTTCSGGKVPNCKLVDWFEDEAAYQKAKPRPLQMLRYELYLSWALQYSSKSLLLNIDFRDTIFQGDPFSVVPKPPPFDIAFFSEYYPNKKIAFCPFNGGWIRSCFGKEAFERVKDGVVLCSGSTMATKEGMLLYANRMLKEHDKMGCVEKGIDQGIHNYLHYSFQFQPARVWVYPQGTGPVNTIGAMHPNNRHFHKGELDEYWKLRDEDGFILNWGGKRSPVIHQFDRFKNLISWAKRKVSCDTCGDGS